MSQKKRLLFVGEAVSLAHVTRPLVLAESLDRNRYDIHFACDPRYRAFINATPHIHYWEIRSIASKTFIKAAERDEYPYKKSDLEFYLDEELDLIKRIQPSLIIGDYRYTLSTSAEMNQVPYAALANVHWSPYRIKELSSFPELRTVRSTIKNIVRNISPWILPLLRRQSLSQINVVRNRHALSPLKNFCELVTHADYTLYADPPNLIQTLLLPSHHIFLGPIIWSPKTAMPPGWRDRNHQIPLIYMTFGSTGNLKQIRDIVRALAVLPVAIVVATAGRIQLKKMPSNVSVFDYLPGIEICKDAAVVLCNGGSSTAYQALSQGTPLVGIWSNRDQYLTMKMIEGAGAGLGCAHQDANPQKILGFILRVLQNSTFRVAAAQFEETFKHYDAGQRFRQFIDGLEERNLLA